MAMESWKELPIFPVIFVTIFLVSGTIMSFILLIASFVIWPLSKHWYRQFSYYCIYPVWSQLVFLIDWWAPSQVYLYSDEEAQKMIGREHAVVVMNHSYDIDWLAGWVVCERCQVLAASKVFAKKSLAYMPVIGWLWALGEIIFVERDWMKDKMSIIRQITQISEYANPVWILLFSEGTRFTEAKHKVSLEFAKKQGLAQLRHMLTPRTKGFTVARDCIRASGNKIRAVYDTLVCFESGPGINEPTLMNIIKGRPVRPHMKFFRIPMEEIPVDEAEASAWLHRSFQQKDDMFHDFLEKNRFEGRRYVLPRRPYDLINEIFWIVTVIGGALYFAFTSTWMPWWVLPLVGVALSFALHFLTNVTVIGKGSAYGKKEEPKSAQWSILTQADVKRD